MIFLFLFVGIRVAALSCKNVSFPHQDRTYDLASLGVIDQDMDGNFILNHLPFRLGVFFRFRLYFVDDWTAKKGYTGIPTTLVNGVYRIFFEIYTNQY